MSGVQPKSATWAAPPGCASSNSSTAARGAPCTAAWCSGSMPARSHSRAHEESAAIRVAMAWQLPHRRPNGCLLASRSPSRSPLLSPRSPITLAGRAASASAPSSLSSPPRAQPLRGADQRQAASPSRCERPQDALLRAATACAVWIGSRPRVRFRAAAPDRGMP